MTVQQREGGWVHHTGIFVWQHHAKDIHPNDWKHVKAFTHSRILTQKQQKWGDLPMLRRQVSLLQRNVHIALKERRKKNCVLYHPCFPSWSLTVTFWQKRSETWEHTILCSSSKWRENINKKTRWDHGFRDEKAGCYMDASVSVGGAVMIMMMTIRFPLLKSWSGIHAGSQTCYLLCIHKGVWESIHSQEYI